METPKQSKRGATLIGCTVRKQFENHGVFTGEVVSYDEEHEWFLVRYEDEDEEEINWAELQQILVSTETKKRRKLLPRVVTPEKEDSDAMNESAEEEEEVNDSDSEFDEAGISDEASDKEVDDLELDEEDLVEEEENEEEESSQRKGRQRRATKASPASKRRKKGTSGACKKKTTAKGEAFSAQSVAVRGLPQGSLARGRGGFEVRSLNGVKPLLTRNNVQKAIELVASGKHQAASSLLQIEDHHSIQAFCKAACQKLGITPTKQLAGGSPLSQRARDRLEEGTASPHADLPGQLLVVRAGTAVCERTGNPLCPLHLEDCVLTAEELHQQTLEPLATYLLQVTSEAAFCPWTVMYQRLMTADLFPLEENEKYRKNPFVVTIEWQGEGSLPTGSWKQYSRDMVMDEKLQWALLEGATRDAPPVIVGVASCLISNPKQEVEKKDATAYGQNDHGGLLLPPLSSEVSQTRLPASLLQKAIRRNFCSPVPVIEACMALLRGEQLLRTTSDASKVVQPPRGGVFAMLSTTFKCMLEDASPFDAPADGSLLGLEELLLLSLIALVDSGWEMPSCLLHKAVATALRAQKQPANLASIARVSRSTNNASDGNWKLKKEMSDSTEGSRVIEIHNALIIMQAALGGRFVHRSLLEEAAPISKEELAIVADFDMGLLPSNPEQRLQNLDAECRLAAYEPAVAPSCLLLLQASLSEPPRSWKKHSLPAIAQQVHKLISNANARMPDHHRLTRLAAWGVSDVVVENDEEADTEQIKTCRSAREIVTLTGVISDKEKEIIDCFEAIQRWRLKAPSIKISKPADEHVFKCRRTEVGLAPTAYDGRIAFLLAFAKAEEIEVCTKDGGQEVVNVLFCGDAKEPLLVQRIGKARKEAELSFGVTGVSGTEAAPSLGYVVRSRSERDRQLFEASERAVAELWKNGRTVSLPLPPAGLQWNLPGSAPGEEEQVESAVALTATLSNEGLWQFTIGGVRVEPFDARKVISPCSMDTQNHKPLPLDCELDTLLRTSLYAKADTSAESVLVTLLRLHERASETRQQGAVEGFVFNWLPVAAKCHISAHIWRDAILALKTREKEDIALGPVLSDGTCKRDMTEGCLLRIFASLECLYPTALIKSGAFKWRVRPRGAGYHHMLTCLDQLSRGMVGPPPTNAGDQKPRVLPKDTEMVETSDPEVERTAENPPLSRDRSKRRAAVACSRAISAIATTETKGVGALAMGQEFRQDCVPSRTGEEGDYLPLPKVTTKLWPHQEASVAKVVSGVEDGRRGHADASAVGAGKTLTALAIIVRLAAHMEVSHGKRSGVLVMLPTKALVKEWLLQIAEHTSGFHVVEQREDGQLFSLTYGKSTPPIDGNTIVISTLDRVRDHPFVRQAAWDFVVIDECLAIQNADAKRCPSAWRQIEVSFLGVLMLSATFFRSKYSDLFYMLRMLRSPIPRSMEWLSATIHEHIVCQVPETDRTWEMRGESVPLPPADLQQYRRIIEKYKRLQINNSAGKTTDFRRLFIDLEAFLRQYYEGRDSRNSYKQTSVLAEACYNACTQLLKEGRRPLVFADTNQEAEHFLGVLQAKGLKARSWAKIASDGVSGRTTKEDQGVIVAVKSVEGQGINMQGHADAIVCRPTPGDHLEQMKGRIDRPGQMTKTLILVVLMAEHTIEEAKFANIHLAGNFFREYIAPVATRYRERIDLEATLAAGGTAKLKKGTVQNAWRRSLEDAGRSGAFAKINTPIPCDMDDEDIEDVDGKKAKRARVSKATAVKNQTLKAKKKNVTGTKSATEDHQEEPKFASLNKVIRNKGDPEAIRQAKSRAEKGFASLAVRRWLFPPQTAKRSGLAKNSLMRFSNSKPPLVLDRETIHKALAHLSNDSKLSALVGRVGANSIIEDCGDLVAPTDASLFNRCIRAITFTMVSVDAGNSFLRRLAMKIGACLECLEPDERNALLHKTLGQMREGSREYDDLTIDGLFQLLLAGKSSDLLFTPALLGALVSTCLVVNGKRTGYPHLCGVSFPCGKNDDHSLFLEKARAHAAGGSVPVSCGYSKFKASFLISLVDDFEKGKISAKKIAKASDREAAKMLLGLKGLGDWSAGVILVFFLKRANIMLYGDLTVRNYLNDLYEINHNDDSETMLESAADFPDTAINRNLIDEVASKNGWEPYRSVICFLMYHLQEENLVLL